MFNKFNRLKNKINDIRDKGYIKIPSKGFGSVGLLLENELGLSINDFSVPDFDEIELKVKKRTSKYPTTLFNSTCDGPGIYELNRVVNDYGAYHYKYRNTKVLFITLSSTKYANWGKNIKMKLHVDRTKEKIFLIVAHSNGKIIEKRAYWDFDTLKSILERKLTYLCYVTYDTAIINKVKFCRFDEVLYLKLKDFEAFLSLIEDGSIIINIMYGVYPRGCKEGKSYNHGTSFRIKKTALLHLFEQLKF